METTLRFNKVFVIQSLGDNEIQTGERLVKSVLEPKLVKLGLGLTYWKVKSRTEFFSAMDEIWKQCTATTPRIYPIIHLDAHGTDDKNGIAILPGIEQVTWDEFVPRVRGINVECHNNLMIVGALCYGLLAIKEINMREPAPFLILIGSENEVSIGEIDSGFVDFYEELLRDGDLDMSFAKLSDKFKMFLSDRLFLITFGKFFKEQCQGKERQDRIERLLAEFMESEASQRVDEKTARRILEDYTMPRKETFKRFKERFLLSNHPSNLDRFDITFDDAVRLANK